MCWGLTAGRRLAAARRVAEAEGGGGGEDLAPPSRQEGWRGGRGR